MFFKKVVSNCGNQCQFLICNLLIQTCFCKICQYQKRCLSSVMRLYDLIPSWVPHVLFRYNWVSKYADSKPEFKAKPFCWLHLTRQHSSQSEWQKENKKAPTLSSCCLSFLLCAISTRSHLSSLLSVMWHGSGLKECSNKKTKPNMDSFWSSAVTNNSISSVWLSNKLNINLLCGMWTNHTVMTVNENNVLC